MLSLTRAIIDLTHPRRGTMVGSIESIILGKVMIEFRAVFYCTRIGERSFWIRPKRSVYGALG